MVSCIMHRDQHTRILEICKLICFLVLYDLLYPKPLNSLIRSDRLCRENNTYLLISNSDALSKASSCSDALSKAPTFDPDDSESCIGDPLATSSPKRTAKEHHSKQKNKKTLRTLIINFQSIKIKRTELPVLLETIQPDVIIGTETWLTKDIGNGKFFPAELGFDAIRRDREGDAHGGTNCIEI